MKRLVLVLIIFSVGVWCGIRAADTVQAGVLQRDALISEAFRK